jgi:hypothetical protein
MVSGPRWIKPGRSPPISQFDRVNILLLLKMVAGWNPFLFLKEKHRSHILHFPQFNQTFHKTNRPPLYQIPILPGHCVGHLRPSPLIKKETKEGTLWERSSTRSLPPSTSKSLKVSKVPNIRALSTFNLCTVWTRLCPHGGIDACKKASLISP